MFKGAMKKYRDQFCVEFLSVRMVADATETRYVIPSLKFET